MAKTLSRQNKHWPSRIILIFAAVIAAIPLVLSFFNAFRTREAIVREPLNLLSGLTTEGITSAFKMMKYPQALMNNIIILVISLVIMIVLGSLMGFAVSAVNSRFLNFAYIAVVLIITIPFQAIMIPIVMVLTKIGLLSTYLGASLVFAATSMSIVVFLYTGFMRSLPKELCEAAVVDGCGIFRTYVSIYMPLLKTVTGTIIIIRGTSVWNDLLVCMITLHDSKLQTMVYRLYSFVSNKQNNWDIVFASAFLVSIPIIIIFIFMQKSFVKGVVAGAVKG